MAIGIRQGMPNGEEFRPRPGFPLPRPAPPIPQGPGDDRDQPLPVPTPIPRNPGPFPPPPQPPRRVPPIPMPNPPEIPDYSPGSPLAEGQRFADAIAATGTPEQWAAKRAKEGVPFGNGTPSLPGAPPRSIPFGNDTPSLPQGRSSMMTEEEALDMLYQMLQGDGYDQE